MSRTLTSAFDTALDEPVLRLAYLCYLDFPSGEVRAWSGIGDLSWDSETWTGVGNLGGISAVEEASGTEAPGVTVELSGIPSELLTLGLIAGYQGRAARIWLAQFDSAGALIADPTLIFGGRMDVAEIIDGDQTGVIRISCETHSINLRRSRVLRYTHAEQTRLFAGDLGLEYVASLQDKPINWGVPAPRVSAPPRDPDVLEGFDDAHLP